VLFGSTAGRPKSLQSIGPAVAAGCALQDALRRVLGRTGGITLSSRVVILL
jgi:hypothetical protein